MADISLADLGARIDKFAAAQEAQYARDAHPLALVENNLRASIADLAVVDAIMAKVEDALIQRLDEVEALADANGYERARREYTQN